MPEFSDLQNIDISSFCIVKYVLVFLIENMVCVFELKWFVVCLDYIALCLNKIF